MRWMLMHEKRNVVEAGEMFPLQKDRTYGKDCPLEQGESSKQKKVDPARFAYTIGTVRHDLQVT
jgi:hypothetical protein